MHKGKGWEVVAKLIDIGTDSGTVVARVQVEEVPAPPIAPAGLYAMRAPGTEVLPLHRLRLAEPAALVFETYEFNSGRTLPEAGHRFLFRSWWAPHQLAAVRDVGRRWSRRPFVPAEAGDPLTAERHGDHRHCLLCYASISPQLPDEPEGFTDGSTWLCLDCHDRYIERDVLRLRSR